MIANNVIFRPPLFGKPNPNEPKPDGDDTRTRVTQKNAKATCVYNTFNFLRDRVKAPNTNDFEQRRFEKSASEWRKKCSNYMMKYLPIITILLEYKDTLSTISKETLDITLQLQKFIKKEFINNLNQIIDIFLNQNIYDNLYEYLKNFEYNGIDEIHNEFLKKNNVTVEELNFSLSVSDPFNYQYLYNNKKSTLLWHSATMCMIKFYNLEISSWNPEQTFEDLKKEIEINGPLAISGLFGSLAYDVPASKYGKKIVDRDIYYWNKTDPKSSKRIGHMILLVGTFNEENNEFVFYIDPNDISDPLNPEKQKIYMMTYQKLTSSEYLCDVYGFRRNNVPKGIGFAVRKK